MWVRLRCAGGGLPARGATFVLALVGALTDGLDYDSQR